MLNLNLLKASKKERLEFFASIIGISKAKARTIVDNISDSSTNFELRNILEEADVPKRVIQHTLNIFAQEDSESKLEIYLKNPSSNERLHHSDDVFIFTGIIFATREWLEMEGIPTPEIVLREESDGASTPIDSVEYQPSKLLSSEINGTSAPVYLSPSVSEGKVDFRIEALGVYIGTDENQIKIRDVRSGEILLTRNFQITDHDESPDRPELELIYNEPDLEFPSHIKPESENLEKMIDLVKRYRPIMGRPITDKEARKKAKRLLEWIKRARKFYPGDEPVLTPPHPGIHDEWRVIPKDLLKLLERLIAKGKKHSSAVDDLNDDVSNDEYFRRYKRERKLAAEYTKLLIEYGEKVECIVFCTIDVNVIVLKNEDKLETTPTKVKMKKVVDETNEFFERGKLKFRLKSYHVVTISDADFDRFVEVGKTQSFLSQVLLRDIGKKHKAKWDEDAVNVIVVHKKNDHLGEHPTVDTKIGGYCAGTLGMQSLPQANTPVFPQHIVVSYSYFTYSTAKVLAHELGHFFGLGLTRGTHYDKLGLIPFTQDRQLSMSEKNRKAYKEATEFKKEMEKKIKDYKKKNPRATREEAIKKVRSKLKRYDRVKFDTVFDLMVLGTRLSCENYRTIRKYIHKHYPTFC